MSVSYTHLDVYKRQASTRSELILSLAQQFPQLAAKDAELAVAELRDIIGRIAGATHQ